MAKDVIIVDNLTKIFDKNLVAVDHISFTVKEGEVFGLLGPNGAGKTTTINMLVTVLKPTEGRASILGYDIVKQASIVRRLIGVVPQDYTADEDLTGYENIILCGDLYGIPREVSKKTALELLEFLGLMKFKDKKVETYSGGMRRRLELACGLVNKPKVLFLDEPTLGLDVQTRAAIWEYIKRLREEYNITILMTTHYMEEADNLCDRIAIIDHGKIVVMGSPEELKNSIGSDVVEVEIKEKDDILDMIQKIEYVKDVKKVGESSYLIRLENGERTAPEIIEFIRDSGLHVVKLSLRKPSLDEVFLTYTGRAIRDIEESRESLMTRRILLRRARG
ncbi:MAG: ATP-binding cassette domain-containing protein [Nitrososphaerota archaeon]|nr:ATP-binding cassette domain-containing protein [Nitrososphaerota archaeon]